MTSRKFRNLSVLMFLLLVSTLPFHLLSAKKMESQSIIVRIVFIEWDLHDDYFTVAGKNQEYTEVTFSVDYQFENTGEENITIEFATLDENVNLRITTVLEDRDLNMTDSGKSIDWPMISNRTYKPGIENRSRDFSFRFNTQGLSQLPKGWYNITPSLEGQVFPEKYEIRAYGVVLEIFDVSYSILYEYNKKIIHYTTSRTSIFLSSIFVGLLVSLSRNLKKRKDHQITLTNNYQV